MNETLIRTHEEIFTEAYLKAFPSVATFVKKMGGSFEEAKDIFQDALVIYYEKKVVSTSAGELNEKAYILGISRHLWYRKFHENKLQRPLNHLHDRQEKEEIKISDQLLRFVERSGKKCIELLTSFYYDKLSMKEISEKFGFSGERSATTQKFKCLEKVRNSIKERALTKEDFYE